MEARTASSSSSDTLSLLAPEMDAGDADWLMCLDSGAREGASAAALPTLPIARCVEALPAQPQELELDFALDEFELDDGMHWGCHADCPAVDGYGDAYEQQQQQQQQLAIILRAPQPPKRPRSGHVSICAIPPREFWDEGWR